MLARSPGVGLWLGRERWLWLRFVAEEGRGEEGPEVDGGTIREDEAGDGGEDAADLDEVFGDEDGGAAAEGEGFFEGGAGIDLGERAIGRGAEGVHQ
jgi:hypothetical protein